MCSALFVFCCSLSLLSSIADSCCSPPTVAALIPHLREQHSNTSQITQTPITPWPVGGLLYLHLPSHYNYYASSFRLPSSLLSAFLMRRYRLSAATTSALLGDHYCFVLQGCNRTALT